MQILNTLQIFIVDDDPFWAEILSNVLRRVGINNISVFENEQSLFSNIEAIPDMIFLDYQLGLENGLEILKNIKSYNQEIDVVFCTSHENLEVAIAAYENGSVEYLLKSYATEDNVFQIINNRLLNSTNF
jgi:DNA-binding NtrC family response regulator